MSVVLTTRSGATQHERPLVLADHRGIVTSPTNILTRSPRCSREENGLQSFEDGAIRHRSSSDGTDPQVDLGEAVFSRPSHRPADTIDGQIANRGAADADDRSPDTRIPERDAGARISHP